MDDYERIHLVKNEVFIYKIPPRQSNRGFRAADWKLDVPDYTARLRLVSKNDNLFIKFEDKISGELFAQCPIPEYPGVALEAVTDSSRYFVVRLQDESGKTAFVGMGFADRGDSFDLNVALQDYFKGLKKDEQASQAPAPKLDLAFKEGQTIKINLKKKETDNATPSKARSKTGGVGFIPPPPVGSAGGGIPTLGPPPMAANQVQRGPSPLTSPSVPSNQASDSLLDLGNSSGQPQPTKAPSSQTSSWVTF